MIPSDAEATLDIRALPDENIDAFLELMRKVIDDPSVQVVPMARGSRPGAAPSRIDTPVYHALEAAIEKVYQTTTLPMMGTGATDMAYLRAKGVQCYGVGAMGDEEDAPKGYGMHSDQERILDEAALQARALLLGGRNLDRRCGEVSGYVTIPRRTALSTSSATLCRSSFSMMRQRCVSTVCRLRLRRLAMSLLLFPSARS